MSDDLDEFGLASDRATTEGCYRKPPTATPILSRTVLLSLAPLASSFMPVPLWVTHISSVDNCHLNIRDVLGNIIARTRMPAPLPSNANSIEVVNFRDAAIEARIVFGLSL